MTSNALWFCALLVASGATAQSARVGSTALPLAVDRATGRIVELVDGASGQNFVSATPGHGGLWELEFTGNPPNTLGPADAQVCRADALPGDAPGLRWTWSGFGLPDAPGLRVEVTARLDSGQAASGWRIQIEAIGERTIRSVRFPRILGLSRLEREGLVVPFWGGLLARNPRQLFTAASGRGGRREYDYPGHCSMQCLAFYSDGGPGLYVACDDTAGYRKLLAAFSDGTPARASGPGKTSPPQTTPEPNAEPDLNLEVVHLPERDPTGAKGWRLPYEVVVGTFQGDWFDAASRYRAWATNQLWARQSRWQRGEVPTWISDTGLWVWNRGRSPNVLEPAIVLQRELGLPVSVFWHWWHGCAYDTGFPEYLPPREGAPSFVAALTNAHAHQVHALVYMNQRLWGMTTASWTNEHAERFAVKAPDGTVRPEVYNTFAKLPCATMCMGTEFWRQKYAGIATEALLRLGVDGIYMDQACSSLACYDPSHGHPAGGGTYWMNGFKTLAADIRGRCSTRGPVALAGEGCAENWLPYLDLMLALDVSRERYVAPDGWEPIPFFHAVYHGSAVFYGSYSSLTMPPYDDLWPAQFAPRKPLELLDRKYSTQFRLEQARAFIWGQQPTIANFLPAHLRERSEEIAYVVRLARLRHAALRYLQEGTMLPLPEVSTPSEVIPISRLSIYAGQQGALKEFEKDVPLVLASAWRADDGRVGIAVASIADQPLTSTITLDTAKCGLPSSGSLIDIERGGARVPVEFTGKALVLRPRLGAREARVFEWKFDGDRE